MLPLFGVGKAVSGLILVPDLKKMVSEIDVFVCLTIHYSLRAELHVYSHGTILSDCIP